LVEVGFTGLMQLFMKLAREGTGKLCDPDAMIRHGQLFPPILLKEELIVQAHRHLQITSRLYRPSYHSRHS
jgi:hypothetical protein